MGRRLALVLVFALVVGLALPVFAEVNNIKVGGDITVYGISRSYFDNRQQKSDTEESRAASIIRLRVDADLTENVSATLRLLNERDWAGQDNGTTADTNGNTVATINLDLAYVTLKEFLYSPLTLAIGRQELHFGNDFIIGDPDRNNNVSGTSLSDADLSSKKAFDAVRGTLNYDPLVIDLLWAKIQENDVFGTNTALEKDDIDLYGVNARYNFGGNWNTVGELYYFGKFDNSLRTGSNAVNEKIQINNIGGRLEITPTERLMLQSEVVSQFGRNIESSVVHDHQAWAGQAIARYALDMKYNPVLMAIYTYYSGDTAGADDNSRGWDPMYENQTNGHIANTLLDPSNFHVFGLRGSIVPVEDLTLTIDNVWYRFASGYANGEGVFLYRPDHGALTTTSITATGDDYIGNELDIELKYNYTEDVQLGLLGGMFFPGDAFSSENTDTVRELIASVKVSF